MNSFSRDTILATLAKHRSRINSFGVKRLSLFGSRATNKARPGSDLDFLVEFENQRGKYRDYMDLLLFLQDLFATDDIDIVKPHLVREELRQSILEGPRYDAEI